MAQKVVSVSLQARVDGFVSGMRKAKSSVDDLTKASDKVTKQDAFGNMANKAAIAGLGVATAVGVAVKRFADFDQAMSAVAANSGATGDSLNALRDAAIEMGAASQFSAKEAADGINELAKAGVATEDILNGGLKGALDLAAAGQIGVAQAAETTASALNQFGLNGTKAGHVADLLANAANAAQGGVGDMGAALAQAGVAANAAGLNIDETTTTLALFAKAGLTGSDAGTSLKTMMQRLSAPTEKAAAEMERLGIAAYDSSGEFIGQEAVMEQLATATADLSTESRAAAFNTIFGTDAIRAASIAADAGAEGYAKMATEVTKFGGAAKQAEQLTDNLKGDIERLGGALDSTFISTGSGANGSLRSLTQGLTALVTQVAKIPGPLLLAGGALSALALLGPKGVMAYRNYTKQLDSLGLSMDKIASRGPRAAKGIDLVTKAAKAFAVAGATAGVTYAIFDDEISGLTPQVLAEALLSGGDAIEAFNRKLSETNELTGRFDSGISDFGDVVKSAFDPSTAESVDRTLGTIKGFFGGTDVSNIAIANQRLTELDAALTGMEDTDAARVFNEAASAAAPFGVTVEELKASLPGYAERLASAGNAAKLAATKSGVMSDATDDLQTAAEKAQTALDDLKAAIEGLGSPVVAQRAATRDYESAIDGAAEALIEQKDALIESRLEALGITEATKAQTAAAEAWAVAQIKAGAGLDVSTAAGRANQANLDAIQASTLAKVNADFALNESTLGTAEATRIATGTMQAGRDAFVAAAIAAGKTKTEAEKLATELGLIPDDVAILVSQSGASEAGAAIDAAAKDRNATIWVNQRAGRRLSDTSSEWQGVGGLATGGAVRGPGTGTSDSILTRLSNGEHVLTAAEVARMGGQSAVYALRSAIRQGRIPKYATGGAVMSTSRFAPPSMMAGSSSYQTTHDRSLNAENVTIVTPDADSFARGQFRTTPYRAKARPGR